MQKKKLIVGALILIGAGLLWAGSERFKLTSGAIAMTGSGSSTSPQAREVALDVPAAWTPAAVAFTAGIARISAQVARATVKTAAATVTVAAMVKAAKSVLHEVCLAKQNGQLNQQQQQQEADTQYAMQELDAAALEDGYASAEDVANQMEEATVQDAINWQQGQAMNYDLRKQTLQRNRLLAKL